MNDLTVVYYTSNREDPRFEGRIQRSLLHNTRGLPLISVSQKPMNFGNNICVGNVGVTGHNALRQMQIGAMEADTKFVCTAESDFIHPREFFKFRPESDDIFCMAMPLYVLFTTPGKGFKFCPKPHGSEGAMIVGREFLIEKMNEMFNGRDKWIKQDIARRRGSLKYLYTHGKSMEFQLPIPVITFKTPNNMHRRTPHSDKQGVRELPYWGKAIDLIRRYRA